MLVLIVKHFLTELAHALILYTSVEKASVVMKLDILMLHEWHEIVSKQGIRVVCIFTLYCACVMQWSKTKSVLLNTMSEWLEHVVMIGGIFDFLGKLTAFMMRVWIVQESHSWHPRTLIMISTAVRTWSLTSK